MKLNRKWQVLGIPLPDLIWHETSVTFNGTLNLDENWVDIDAKEIRKGDVIRVFEKTGELIVNQNGNPAFVVTDEPHHWRDEDGDERTNLYTSPLKIIHENNI